MADNEFNLSARMQSFKFALAGIWTILKSQHNAWVHACATVAVVLAGFFFHVTSVEWCLLVLAAMAVWMAEGLNTAIEFLADVVSPDFHPLVKKAKDAAAGAVLITAIGSGIIGVLVFGPYVF